MYFRVNFDYFDKRGLRSYRLVSTDNKDIIFKWDDIFNIRPQNARKERDYKRPFIKK